MKIEEREREREIHTMMTFRYHSARVACQRKGNLALASYSGPLCNQAFEVLRPHVVRATSGSTCLVIRVDNSLCLMGTAPLVKDYQPGAMPGAVIVRLDQYALWTDYAKAMAQVGIIRAVFPVSELAMCREWVDFQLFQQAVPQ